MPLWITLIATAIATLAIGILYAAYIYHHPLDRTWLSVVIGTAITDTGASFAIGAILLDYGLLAGLWWLAGAPWVFSALGGLPQIIFQEYKHRQQRKEARELRDSIKNGNGGY